MKTFAAILLLIFLSSCSLEGEKGSLIIEISETAPLLWLDASDIDGDGSTTSNLDPITNWTDKSGRANDADGTASSPVYNTNALNGMGVVSFAETEWLDVDLGALNSPITIIVLCRFDHLNQPGGNDDYVISLGLIAADSHLSVGRYRNSGNVDKYFVNNGGGNFFGPLMTANQWILISQTSSIHPTYHHVKINSTERVVDDFAATINTNGEMGIGYFRAAASEHFLGSIAELLVYDSKLTSTEISAIEFYLTIKWGL